MMAAKNAPQAAIGTLGYADALETVLERSGAAILPPQEHSATVAWLKRKLWRMANDLVREINDAVGEDALYLMECLGTWLLYGRASEEDVDKLLLCGRMNVDGLVRLAGRLQGGKEGIA